VFGNSRDESDAMLEERNGVESDVVRNEMDEFVGIDDTREAGRERGVLDGRWMN